MLETIGTMAIGLTCVALLVWGVQLVAMIYRNKSDLSDVEAGCHRNHRNIDSAMIRLSVLDRHITHLKEKVGRLEKSKTHKKAKE